MDAAAGVDAHDAPTPACETARRAVSHKRPQPVSFLLITPLKNPEAVPTLRHASRLLHFRVTVNKAEQKRKDGDRPDRVEGRIESLIQGKMRSRGYDFDW